MTDYIAWTAKDVEYRVLEAAETLMLLPAAKGPQAYGTAMPGYVQDWHAYASEPSHYKRRPSRDALDRMPETWGWINAFLTEPDRKLVYAWAWVKVRRGKTINDFASREGMDNRTLRRTMTRIFNGIAGNLNRLHAARLKISVDGVSELTAEIDPEQVSSVKYAKHWRAPDAKPRHLPERLEPIVQRNPAPKRVG